MKYTIIAILLLACITAYFSIYGEIVPLESQKEGWAFFGGTFGDPVPSEGADGQMDAFVANAEAQQETQAQAEQTAAAQAQQKPPITVSVEYPKADKKPDWEMFAFGMAAGALAAEVATACVFGILILKDNRKRRNSNEKRKIWTRAAHRMP